MKDVQDTRVACRPQQSLCTESLPDLQARYHVTGFVLLTLTCPVLHGRRLGLGSRECRPL